MKDNFTHVCFIIDESGSMYSSTDSVKKGFAEIVSTQKADKSGDVAVSMITFDGDIKFHYIGKDINTIEENLNYSPNGNTALNDAVAFGIKSVGAWLNGLSEAERPASNLIVVMTDGGENSSHYYDRYANAKIKEMIKHQEEKYNWQFMYIGADITTSEIADDLGIKTRAYSTKSSLYDNMSMLNSTLSSAKAVLAKDAVFALQNATSNYADVVTSEFAAETGVYLASNANDLDAKIVSIS